MDPKDYNPETGATAPETEEQPTQPVAPRRFPTAKPGTPENKQYRTAEQVEKIITDALGDRMGMINCVHLPDVEYFLPPLGDVEEILRYSEVDRRKYISEINDCDDFAHTLKSDFILAAYAEGARRAPFAFGIIWGLLPEAHAQNWVITDDEVLHIIEPQNDQISTPDVITQVWLMVA